MKVIIFVLFFLSTISAYSQKDRLIGKWTNGYEFFYSEVYNDSLKEEK